MIRATHGSMEVKVDNRYHHYIICVYANYVNYKEFEGEGFS